MMHLILNFSWHLQECTRVRIMYPAAAGGALNSRVHMHVLLGTQDL